MDFPQATRMYEELLRRRNAGELDEAAFQQALGSIRVEDASGYSWTIDAAGRWLYWNGSAWVPAEASNAATSGQGSAPAPVSESPSSQGAPDVDQAIRKAFRWIPLGLGMLRGRLPPASVFLQQMRHVPLKKRPQPWWDALAIMGGAIGGFLWFLYSSVRGMPHFAPLRLQNESFFDLIPPLVMAGMAVLLFLFRRQIARLMAPLGKIPLVGRLGGGLVFLIIGLLVRYKSGLFQTREGLDLITPLLMLFLPIIIVLFRKPLDAVLLPFDPIRRKIPRIILVILGLAAPYLVAHIIYNWFNMFMYPFLRVSVVFGTMISYAILRTPARPPTQARVTTPGGTTSPPPLPGGAASRQMLKRRAAWVGLVWILGLHLFFITPAFADDFLRDPFNGNDGLRTPGVATAMAGTVTVIVSGLVNGAEVVRTVIEAQSGEGGSGAEGGSGGAESGGAAGSGDEQQEPRKVHVQADTFDNQGYPSTRIEPGGRGPVFVYADCVEVGKGQLKAETAGISFHLASGAQWVQLVDHGMLGGKRCAGIDVVDPMPQGTPPASVVISVTAAIEGKLISVPVTVELIVSAYRIRFR